MELNRNLSKEQIQSPIKYFKICSTCLTTRKMQIKVTLRLPLTPVKMTIIRNTDDYMMISACMRGNGNSFSFLIRESKRKWKLLHAIGKRINY